MRYRVEVLLLLVLSWFAPAHAGDSVAVNFPVPAITIQTGDLITPQMIVQRRLIANSSALRSFYTASDSVVGRTARRPLVAGAAIPLNALRDAYVFKEGERVTVEYVADGLSIRGYGVALQPGVVGGAVRVRSADTGAIINGVVRSDGSILVGG